MPYVNGVYQPLAPVRGLVQRMLSNLGASHIAEQAGVCKDGPVIIIVAKRDDGHTVQTMRREHPYTSYGKYNLSPSEARTEYWRRVQALDRLTD